MKNLKTKISDNGPELSRIISGVWRWGKGDWELNTDQIRDLIEAGVDCGITTFDHADLYADYTIEADFGKALKQDSSLRDKIEIITKCDIRLISPNRPEHKIKSYDTSKKHITKSVENSLKSLQTDYIDVLLIHRPDPLMDPDEIAETISQLKKEGKIKYFGVSNFTPSQFEMLNAVTELVTNQVEISVLNTDPIFNGTLDQCILKKISPMAWSPFGGGQIFKSGGDERTERIRKVLFELADKYDCDIDQLLLAWLLRHPSNILPILGTARSERLKKAVEALHINLEREEWFMILEASHGEEVP